MNRPQCRSNRYTVEVGTETVNALFAVGRSIPKATTYLCHAEACSTLRRKLNQSAFDLTAFSAARALLWDDVLGDPEFLLMAIEADDMLAGVDLIDRYNLNASDAAILTAYLRYARTQPPGSPTCVLVAADQGLLRAAASEGLRVLNPEAVPAADIAGLLSTT